MIQNKSPAPNGFTLIELLVALIVSALLMSILFDGLVGARERAQHQAESQQALLLASEMLETRRDGGAVTILQTGERNGLLWRIEEIEIARDPRQQFALVAVGASAGPKRAPRLVSLNRRYLRAVQ